jgi:hypothetical protein
VKWISSSAVREYNKHLTIIIEISDVLLLSKMDILKFYVPEAQTASKIHVAGIPPRTRKKAKSKSEILRPL